MYAAPSASAQASLLPAERLVRQMTVTAKLDAHVGSFTTWHSDGPFLAIGLVSALTCALVRYDR